MSNVRPIYKKVLSVFSRNEWIDYDGTALYLSRLIEKGPLNSKAIGNISENFLLFNKISKARVIKDLELINDVKDTERNPIINVLLLTASPEYMQDQIRVDKEYRKIKQKIRAATLRNSFVLHVMPAAERTDIIDEINTVKPTILQISSHGDEKGLVFDGDDEWTADLSALQLEKIVATATPQLKVVILNACLSFAQAKALTKYVDIAIGMLEEIGDQAAIDFSTQFYSSLAEGKSIQTSYDQALIFVGFSSEEDASIPVLYSRKGIDPAKYSML